LQTRSPPSFRRLSCAGEKPGQGTAFGKAVIQRYPAFLNIKAWRLFFINVQIAVLSKLAMKATDNDCVIPL